MYYHQFQFTPLREGRQRMRDPTTLPALFQFTPLREGRHVVIAIVAVIAFVFQFTPLREGRHYTLLFALVCFFNFNSRPCGRGDRGQFGALQVVQVFQFTPLREGRHGDQPGIKAVAISIHAPAGGATLRSQNGGSSPVYFNSRPCGRGDARCGPRRPGWSYFNSRPCGRGDMSATRSGRR